jgi:arginine deiminase
VASVLDDPRLGETLRASIVAYLADQDPRNLAETLMAGLAHEEMKPNPAAWSTG